MESTNWHDDRLNHLSGQVGHALQRSMIYTLASVLTAFGSALLAIQL